MPSPERVVALESNSPYPVSFKHGWGRNVRRTWLLSSEQRVKGNSISLLIVFVCREKKKKQEELEDS